jgi:hypothetical protein
VPLPMTSLPWPSAGMCATASAMPTSVNSWLSAASSSTEHYLSLGAALPASVSMAADTVWTPTSRQRAAQLRGSNSHGERSLPGGTIPRRVIADQVPQSASTRCRWNPGMTRAELRPPGPDGLVSDGHAAPRPRADSDSTEVEPQDLADSLGGTAISRGTRGTRTGLGPAPRHPTRPGQRGGASRLRRDCPQAPSMSPTPVTFRSPTD